MPSAMLEQLTTQFVVGKIDAGLSMLLTDDLRVIEFPSVLLPESVDIGSIVQVQMLRNEAEEKKRKEEFCKLQEWILEEYGRPVACKDKEGLKIAVKNVTQTTLSLEWSQVELYNSELRGIDCFVNGTKANSYIMHKPNSLKLSGLDMEKEYKIQIVIRTSGGSLSSNTMNIKTHGISEMGGIVITMGSLTAEEKEEVSQVISEIGGQITETLSHETTHFITSDPHDPLFEEAMKLNIPVVTAKWIKSCKEQKKMIPVRDFYLK